MPEAMLVSGHARQVPSHASGLEASELSLRNSPYSRLGAYLGTWVNFEYLEPADAVKRQQMRAAVLEFMQRQRPDDLVRAVRPFLSGPGVLSAEEAKRRLRAFLTCDIATVAAAVRSMVLVEADRLFLREGGAVERRRAAHRRLFSDPAAHAVVDMWWRALPKDATGLAVTRETFVTLLVQMSSELRPDVPAEEAARAAVRDFEREAGEGAAALPCAPFVDFLFDVAGSWARSPDSHSYCALLADLYGKVFSETNMGDEGGSRSASPKGPAAASSARAYTPLFGPGGDPFVPELGPPANTYHGPRHVHRDKEPGIPPPPLEGPTPRTIARNRSEDPQYRNIPPVASSAPVLSAPRGRPRNHMRASHARSHHSARTTVRASSSNVFPLGSETRRFPRRLDGDAGYPLETAILYRLAECVKNGAAPPAQAKEVIDMFDAGILPPSLLASRFPPGTKTSGLRRFLEGGAAPRSPPPAPRQPPPPPPPPPPAHETSPPASHSALFDRRLDLLLRMHAARGEAKRALGRITSRPLPIPQAPAGASGALDEETAEAEAGVGAGSL